MQFYSKLDNQKLKSYAEKFPMAAEDDQANLPMNTLKFFTKQSIQMYSQYFEKIEYMSQVFGVATRNSFYLLLRAVCQKYWFQIAMIMVMTQSLLQEDEVFTLLVIVKRAKQIECKLHSICCLRNLLYALVQSNLERLLVFEANGGHFSRLGCCQLVSHKPIPLFHNWH